VCVSLEVRTDLDELFWRVEHGPQRNRLDFGGNPVDCGSFPGFFTISRYGINSANHEWILLTFLEGQGIDQGPI